MNTCNCPHPPGGEVVCESNQMAVCIIEKGKARQQCLNPPDIQSSLSLLNWTLSKLTKKYRNRNRLLSEEEIKVLQLGEGYLRKRSTEAAPRKISFSLPPKIQKALRNYLRNNSEEELSLR